MLKNGKHRKIYSIINSNADLLRDIQEMNDYNFQSDNHIYLFNIFVSLRNIINRLFNDKDNIENNMERIVREHFGPKSSIVIYQVDSNKVILGFTSDMDKYSYQKIEINLSNIIKMSDDNSINGQIYKILKTEIKNLVTLNKVFSYYESQYTDAIRAVNSNLKINISLYSIDIYISSGDDEHKRLHIKYNTYDDCLDLQGDKNFVEIVRGKELDILNNIYINLSDCPSYCFGEINKRKIK